MVFVEVHPLDDFIPFADKLAPAFVCLIVDDVCVGEQPLVLGSSFLVDLLHGQLVHEVEVDGDQPVQQHFPHMPDVADDELAFVVNEHVYLFDVLCLVVVHEAAFPYSLTHLDPLHLAQGRLI